MVDNTENKSDSTSGKDSTKGKSSKEKAGELADAVVDRVISDEHQEKIRTS